MSTSKYKKTPAPVKNEYGKLKLGDHTDWGKVVSSFRKPTPVMYFDVSDSEANAIVDKGIANGLGAYVGNKKLYLFGEPLEFMFQRIGDELSKSKRVDYTERAIAITDRDVIVTPDMAHDMGEEEEFYEAGGETGKPLSYNEWFKKYMEEFRRDHPNSTAPSDHLLSDFYDGYVRKFANGGEAASVSHSYKKGGIVGRYTDSKEPLFEDGETVWVMLNGTPREGVILEHICSKVEGQSGQYRHDYLVSLGAGSVERFMQNALASTKGELEEQFYAPIMAKGGEIMSLSELPSDLTEQVNAGKVTYRGTGNSGESKIKVHGKEYIISSSDFDKLGGLAKIRFSAPERRGYEDGGETMAKGGVVKKSLIGKREHTVKSSLSQNMHYHVHEYDNGKGYVVVIKFADYPDEYVEYIYPDLESAKTAAEERGVRFKKGGEVAESNKKFGRVMHEFKNGNLKDRWGNTVTSHGQALAIAYSESMRPDTLMAKGGEITNFKDDITGKAIKFLQSKGYSIDAYSEINRDAYIEAPNGETLVMVQGSKRRDGGNVTDYGIAYFIEDFEEPISKNMLRHIKEEFRIGKTAHRGEVTLYTNAGLEVHSKEMKDGAFEGIKIEKVNIDNIKAAAGAFLVEMPDTERFPYILTITKDGKTQLVDKYTNVAAAHKIKRMIDTKYKPRIEENAGQEYAKGGKIGFDGLVRKVEKEYEGKTVSPKYRKKYGKKYNAEEAHEAALKVAGSVKASQGTSKYK